MAEQGSLGMVGCVHVPLNNDVPQEERVALIVLHKLLLPAGLEVILKGYMVVMEGVVILEAAVAIRGAAAIREAGVMAVVEVAIVSDIKAQSPRVALAITLETDLPSYLQPALNLLHRLRRALHHDHLPPHVPLSN
jgi:hypothetical protein